MTDQETINNLLGIVKDLKNELVTVADEAGQTMSAENRAKLDGYVLGVQKRLMDRLDALLPQKCGARTGAGCTCESL